MKSIALIGAGLAAAVATGASATVTGLQVEYGGVVGGRHVWSVFAVSSNTQNVMLNIIGHTVTAGSMADVQHNNSGTTGRWLPSATGTPAQEANDSFVTIDGLVGFDTFTVLDGSFPNNGAGSVIPNGAGWYNGSPESPILFTGGRIKIMQVAGANYSNVAGGSFYTGRLTVGYKLNSTATTPLYAENLTYTIGVVPAPGALALLGLAGLAGRRRRA